ncbi:MAG: MFS transporter [Candidatus Aminicenantes bacterium]|jgi:dipeptide/tripeptide permease
MNSEQQNQSAGSSKKKGFFTKFSVQFWLVVMFEFFERGAYYGMMSFISVYFVDSLGFPKENVGVIKGVIQPLLYFLPILSGAIADRFGYRKVLMVAFTLLGGGYFLTSQMTSYTAVFAALVIMGFGAGTFKPLISGTIAKITDESNSTQAFGIYYWSINMGAFLFPLILVPILKSMNPTYVIIASGICTAAMLIPTALFFKEPTRQKEVEENTKKREQASLLQTVANAFEIIYSPIVLLHNAMKKSSAGKIVIILLLIVLLGYSGWQFFQQKPVSESYAAVGIEKGDSILIFTVERDMLKKDPYELKTDPDKTPEIINLTIYKPRFIDEFVDKLLKDLGEYLDLASITRDEIIQYIKISDEKIELIFELDTSAGSEFNFEPISENQYKVVLKDLDGFEGYRENLLNEIHQNPRLRGITLKNCNRLHEELKGRSFFLLFVISLILIGLIIVAVSTRSAKEAAVPDSPVKSGFQPSMFIVPLVILGIWFLPGVGPLGKIICSVIYLSIMSLFIIDKTDTQKFVDHAKFLLMIVLYSGFWVLYFQMFDSVLWYVQAFIDATALNNFVNSFLGIFGIEINWFFDVEHITVINALTIIILQLIVSSIVKKKKAMPTMITGIAFGTIGIGILAIAQNVWILIIGIVVFSIGEMTAHPKFISYIGLVAPSDKKAMYMGYIFLYGVFGSSVGGIMGAKLYVHFVDNLNQPRTFWLVFAGIGILTIIGLLLYNKFLAPKKVEKA